MAIDDAHRYPDNLDDEIGRVLRDLRSIPTWTARKFEIYAEFASLARKKGYLHFTADVRDYRLSGSGNSCLYQVPFNQRGALSAVRWEIHTGGMRWQVQPVQRASLLRKACVEAVLAKSGRFLIGR